jgi:hypothetical protein
MATFGRRGGPARGPHAAPPPPPRRRPTGDRARRPPLTLVRDPDPYCGPVALRTLVRSPMPGDVRGALVTAADCVPGGRLQVVWASLGGPTRIPPGQILLSWVPAREDHVDVTARLGLPGGQVLLATWPGLYGDWSDVVRPTVSEVRELHAALRLATAVLDRLADGPNAGTEGTEDPDYFPGA